LLNNHSTVSSALRCIYLGVKDPSGSTRTWCNAGFWARSSGQVKVEVKVKVKVEVEVKKARIVFISAFELVGME